MRIKVDISKLPAAPYPKTQPPKPKKPDIPFEYSVVQEVEAKKKNRNWKLVRRGVNEGQYGAPRYWTPERNAVLMKLRLEGKTYEQIGEELGKSKDAVRRQWYMVRDGRAPIKKEEQK